MFYVEILTLKKLISLEAFHKGKSSRWQHQSTTLSDRHKVPNFACLTRFAAISHSHSRFSTSHREMKLFSLLHYRVFIKRISDQWTLVRVASKWETRNYAIIVQMSETWRVWPRDLGHTPSFCDVEILDWKSILKPIRFFCNLFTTITSNKKYVYTFLKR